MKNKKKIKKKSWDAFQKIGLFWFVNRTLHLVGWALVYEKNRKGKIKNVYPARTVFRGFSNECETSGFKSVTNYLAKNIKQLKKEAQS